MTDDITPVTAAQAEQIVIAALQRELQPLKQDVRKLETNVESIHLNMVEKQELRIVRLQLMQTKEYFDNRFNWLQEGIDQVLVVMGNKEKEVGAHLKDHDKRIKRLERKTGLVKAAV
jgi:hypothetical protein